MYIRIKSMREREREDLSWPPDLAAVSQPAAVEAEEEPTGAEVRGHQGTSQVSKNGRKRGR
jgi:hypothetical protein